MAKFGRVREPFLSISHAFGILIGIYFWLLFSISFYDHGLKLLAISIYSLSFIVLFAASALYHGVSIEDELQLLKYEKADYACIYLFIAGTYTPICLLALPQTIGITVLACEWLFAAWGCYSVMRKGFAGRLIQVPIFLVMGWFFLFAINSILAGLTNLAILYLFLGTLCYTLGAILFAVGPKHFFNGRLCCHGIWHVSVLFGAVSHSLMVANILEASQ